MQNSTNSPPTGEAGASGARRTVGTFWGVIILLAVAVIIFGGAYTWATYNDPLDYDSGSFNFVTKSNRNSNANTNLNANNSGNGNQNTNSDKLMPNWNTFEITDLGIYFQYPKEWGKGSLKTGTAQTGVTKTITFSTEKKVFAGYTSTDFSEGREGTFIEMMNLNKNVGNIKDCVTLKASQSDPSVTACEDVTKNGATIGFVVSYSFTSEEMLSGDYTVGYYLTNNISYPVVGIQVSEEANTFVTTFKTIIQTFGKL